MKNIIITGGGLFNKGAQSMLFVTVDNLRKKFPEHRIYLLSPMDNERPVEEKKQYAFDFMGWYPVKFAKCQSNKFLRAIELLRNGVELREAEVIYNNTDLMVDISGYALGSNWSYATCNDYLEHFEFAKAFGIPFYIMPQSFGPFDFKCESAEKLNSRIKNVLSSAEAIFAREKEGYDALRSTYGLENVYLKDDIVLCSREIDLKNVLSDQPVIDIPEIEKGSVAVVPNIRNIDVGKNEKELLSLYGEIIKLLNDKGRKAYIIYHSTPDRDFCRKIKENNLSNDDVVFLDREFSCIEYSELVGKFDFSVALRFHSIVHAYKKGVPCITLGWATKYADLLQRFEQEKYMFDVRSSLNVEEILFAVEKLCDNFRQESDVIKEKLADIQKENVFDFLRLRDENSKN